MMQFFRKHANGPIFKGLMLLLALTFVVWGIGDVVRVGNKQVAFKVGDVEVSTDEWQRALVGQVGQIEEQVGRKLEQGEIEAFGIKQVLLNQMINKQLLLLESRNLHLLVSDDMVKYEISAMPIFYKEGKFDKEKFSRFLRQVNMSEEQFIHSLKEDITTQNMILGLTLNKEPSIEEVSAIIGARGQTREFKLYEVNKSQIGQLPQPDDEELRKVYDQFKDGFVTEELRDFQYIKFSIDDVKDNRVVTDDELKDAYEAKRALYSEQEKREVTQMLFQDEKLAQKASSEIVSGKSFKEVANEMKENAKVIDVDGAVTRDTFDKEISDAIFSAKANGVTNVVKSPLGYHIFLVKEVVAGSVKSFDEVRAALQKQLMEEHKFDELSKIAQDIEDEVTRGAKLKDIALKYSFQLNDAKSVSKGAIGDGKTGKFSHFGMVFGLQDGSVSSVTPVEGNGYVVAEVTKIYPKEHIPYENVKDKIYQIWKDNKINLAVYDKGKELSQALKEGKAVTNNFQVMKLNWFDAQKSSLPANLKSEIQRLNIKEVSMPVRDMKSGSLYVVEVMDIKLADLSKFEDKRPEIALELTENATNELLTQYFMKLRKKYEVKIIDIGE